MAARRSSSFRGHGRVAEEPDRENGPPRAAPFPRSPPGHADSSSFDTDASPDKNDDILDDLPGRGTEWKTRENANTPRHGDVESRSGDVSLWQRRDAKSPPRNYAAMMPMLASISSLRRHNSSLERQNTRASLQRLPRSPSSRSELSTPHSSVPSPRDKSDEDDGYDTDLEEDSELPRAHLWSDFRRRAT